MGPICWDYAPTTPRVYAMPVTVSPGSLRIFTSGDAYVSMFTYGDIAYRLGS